MIASVVLYCGKQGISPRGDTEKLDKPGKPENFLVLLQILAVNDKVLGENLESPAMRSAKQFSPRHKMNCCNGTAYHLAVKEINAACYYAIADEVIENFSLPFPVNVGTCRASHDPIHTCLA